ncbi:hypothetical protein [Senegalia massiliensis]|uniref:hypothetical protein n=1 Tax=Senegalia massiliensis TaxID=1720316 RepID=UPI001030F9CC|nr:hypothetical protein [Senegalia massiliensis]
MNDDRFKPYWELCEDIEIWTNRYESYQIQFKALKKLANLDGPKDISAIDYSQPYVKGSGQLSFDEILDKLKKLESHMVLHSNTINEMLDKKESMEEQLKELKGLKYKVAYKRDIEGKTLKAIAEELNYNYNYIRRIAIEIPSKQVTTK